MPMRTRRGSPDGRGLRAASSVCDARVEHPPVPFKRGLQADDDVLTDQVGAVQPRDGAVDVGENLVRVLETARIESSQAENAAATAVG